MGMATTMTRVWPKWLFRAAITCEAVFAFAQAVLAGGFLAGHYDFLAMHKENATITGITGINGLDRPTARLRAVGFFDVTARQSSQQDSWQRASSHC